MNHTFLKTTMADFQATKNHDAVPDAEKAVNNEAPPTFDTAVDSSSRVLDGEDGELIDYKTLTWW